MNDAPLTALLQQQREKLQPRCRPELLPGSDTLFQFQFRHQDAFALRVNQGVIEFLPGETLKPEITLMLDRHETLWALLDGKLDGMQAFMDGLYRSDGNIVLSQLLLHLFTVDRVSSYEVKD